ncbi:hypothetical protein [Arthrobacter sp. IK3]|uniref:hypothetical protein n=1 Tax=Arthrobacter sp. IK3 TaxID=3448169 RepID=UPI003EDF71A8
MNNVININRQPQGIPAGGQFAATAHTEAAGVSLGRHAAPQVRPIPESLLMGQVQDPQLTNDLNRHVEMAAGYGMPEYNRDAFLESVPYVPRGEAEELFYMAMDSASAGDRRAYCETAAARNSELHPGGAVSGYTPPRAKVEQGYQQGLLTTGEKHDPYRDITAVAADIRTELKEAAAGNYLPAGLTYSVRTSRFSGGQSVDITVRGVPDEDRLDPDKYDETYKIYGWRDEAEELRKRVEEIANAYNRVDTDTQADYFNYSYYAHVTLEDDRMRELREHEAEQRRLKREAAKSA